MKQINLILGMVIVALGFTSCKNVEEKIAEKSIETYVIYVDSVGNVAAEEAKLNWDEIDYTYQMKVTEADFALENLKEKEEAQGKIVSSKAKFELLKAKYLAEMNATEDASAKQQMRSTLFGEDKIGDDLNFDWVSKDNILGVYEQFVSTVSFNKDNYSREDWDGIKILYEALDIRKKTVEKEGLSSNDNIKIANLILKFATMFTLHRLGTKSE